MCGSGLGALARCSRAVNKVPLLSGRLTLAGFSLSVPSAQGQQMNEHGG